MIQQDCSMRIVAAPCSFKESLTARAVASLMARVASGAGHVVDVMPLADGGEGTLDALTAPLGLELRSSVIRRMLEPGVTHVRWGLDREGRAFIEAAEAIGLALVPPHERDPTKASTRGLGDLIVDVMRDPDVHDVFLALGGTATVDGGADLRAVVEGAARRVPLTALVDVDVPLDGARMFMKQKLGPGQGDDVVNALAARLAAMYAPDIARVAGAGAAGGLGAAVLALGGRLVPGAAYVMDAIGLEERVAGADVVWTGEGRIDEQTVHGKAVASLARMCRVMKKPLVAFCGTTRGSLMELMELGVTEVVQIAPIDEPVERALANAARNLERALTMQLRAP
jgi:glycerate kinase